MNRGNYFDIFMQWLILIVLILGMILVVILAFALLIWVIDKL